MDEARKEVIKLYQELLSSDLSAQDLLKARAGLDNLLYKVWSEEIADKVLGYLDGLFTINPPGALAKIFGTKRFSK
jgi:hypothetical protein